MSTMYKNLLYQLYNRVFLTQSGYKSEKSACLSHVKIRIFKVFTTRINFDKTVRRGIMCVVMAKIKVFAVFVP